MVEKKGIILFVEDDKVDQMAFTRFAEDAELFPYDYVLAGSVKEAESKLSESVEFDAVVMDYLLGDGTAFDLFDKTKGAPVILVTGTGDIDIAIQAMKKGAYDYLEKDPSGNYLKVLKITVENAIDRKKSAGELVEYRQHLEDLVAERTTDLQQAVEKYQKAEQQIEQAFGMQRVINQLLQVALEPVSLEQHLEKILDKIMSLSWADIQQHGAIFLVDDENPDLLVMKAAKGLGQRQQEVCHNVAFGTCICGRAAKSRTALMIDGDDPRHEIKLQDSEPHAHYCMPILSSGDNVLGVISLYFKKGHISSAMEEGNLVAIARTTATIIEHFKSNEKREELQNQLIQAQKMESIGRLAGGVAHDFNNMLSAINGYASLILSQVEDDNPLKEYAEIILSSGERAAGLTRQLLAFSRKEIIKPQVLNLNKVIAEGQKMLGRMLGEDIIVDIITGNDLWGILADQTQLNQIVMNLAVNARDAMPKGGRLTIETRNVNLGEHDLKRPSLVVAGDYVMLIATDTGCGMSKEVVAQIFEPFFTTKEIDKGTGLGLSTVYGIVKQNQGNIDVQSEIGKGSTFNIYFPRIEYSGNVEGSKQLASLPRGTETILLAEDDLSIRNLVSRILTSLGYSVLEAKNGKQALEISTHHSGEIDLLLTDVVMPGMSGSDLAVRLEEKRGAMKILFMSGYTNDSVAIQEVIRRGAAFLQKPIALGSLALEVRTVLDSVKG